MNFVNVIGMIQFKILKIIRSLEFQEIFFLGIISSIWSSYTSSIKRNIKSL